ncbi:hypothetical protein CLM71_08560 [Serratia sp. MYb239]|uniref:hypothetical protein n=1 Tax=Serratia sp. MYb239 TaxID=2033438 RepID=UPI000CF6CB88|nr:hypothetical protein [Serratia sp. MYb239]AVJ17179.1 hypothetical protein CLM71_08560 [Serratia sp. MYb239]
MIDKYRLDNLRLLSGEKGELARWVIQLQADLDTERRKKTSLDSVIAELEREVSDWRRRAEHFEGRFNDAFTKLAAREAVPVYQMRILDGSQEQYTWAEVTHDEFNTPLKNLEGWEKRVLFTVPPAPEMKP